MLALVLCFGGIGSDRMDIVAQLRQWGSLKVGDPLPADAWGSRLSELLNSSADTIEFLRTEVERLHAQLTRANCPVVDARNSEESA